MVMKCVIYLRVSTTEQKLGLQAQADACSAFAVKNKFDIFATHFDELSGSTPVDERPGLLNAINDLRLGGCGVLLIQKRDRLARDIAVATIAEGLARKAKARILTADGTANDDTPEGLLVRQLLDVVAGFEKAQIKARVKAALAVKMRRGDIMGRPPFVATTQGKEALLAIQKLRASGESYATCARWLRKNFVPTPSGKGAWNKRMVKVFLSPRARAVPRERDHDPMSIGRI